MKRQWILCTVIFLFATTLQAQWVAGPMSGPVELREAKVWIATKSPKDEATFMLKNKLGNIERTISPEYFSNYEFNTCVFTIGGLEPGTQYDYTISVKTANGGISERKGKIKTKSLFQWRNPAPDFSF